MSSETDLRKAKTFSKEGKFSEAEHLYRNILTRYPKNLRAQLGLNSVLSKISSIESNTYSKSEVDKLIGYYNNLEYKLAEAYSLKLIEKYPKASIFYNILGAIYTNLNNFESAVLIYRKAIKIDPNNAEIYNNLGATFKRFEKNEDAILNFRKAIEINPNYSSAYNNLGVTFKDKGKLNEAIIYFNKAIKIKPNYTEVYYNKGNALSELENYHEAVESYSEAIKISPNYAEAHNNLGSALNILKEYKKAYNSINKALSIKEDYADAFNNLGQVLTNYSIHLNIDKDKEAINCYNRALQIDPNLIEAHSNLCDIYEKLNKINDLKKTIHKALLVNKYDSRIQFRLAQLESREKNHYKVLKLLEEMDTEGLSYTVKLGRYELLGKTYDKLKKYNQAIECFINAKKTIKTNPLSKNYNPDNYKSEIRLVTKSYKNSNNTVWNNYVQDNQLISPVFLVGFPRSGTTLLDIILSSHPNIITLEEKPMISKVKKRLGRIATFENISNLSENDISELKSVYFKELGKYLNIEKDKLFIDKLPLNIVDVGLINRLFPNSKFILVLRNPYDCVLSCFMQSLELNDAMSNFLDIKNAANLYDLVMILWEEYEKKLQLNYHKIKYENLVINLEKEAKLLLKSIGLDWNEKLHDYQNTALSKKINTPSYNQVTEKLYTGATNRWKNYGLLLDPIMPILEKWTKKWNY